MPEEKTIVPEAGENASPVVDNSTVTPTEEPKGSQEVKLKEDIDPRIVDIVGKEKVESAFGEQPEKEEKPAEEEEKKETPPANGEENQEEKADTKKQEIVPDTKPTRLDRRLASRYIRVLHLSGEEKIPTEEEVIADLKNYSKEEKIQALQFHLRREKELRGEKPTGDDFDDEDKEAIKDADRESIRQEVKKELLQEEHEKQYASNFVSFVDSHQELLEGSKEYNPKLARAVETLWKGGMPINEAFETVTEQIQAVKDEQIAKAKEEKNMALSGVLSGAGQVPVQGKELGWDDVKKISDENPELYRRMLAEGKFKHLE